MLTCPEKSTIVRTRLVSPDDMGRVLDTVFAGLSARSRYLRFHAPISRLPGPLRRQLADVDGQHGRPSSRRPDPGEAVPIASSSWRSVPEPGRRAGRGRRLAAPRLGRCLRRRSGAGGRAWIHRAARLVLSENAAMRRLAPREFPLGPGSFGGETTELPCRSAGRSWDPRGVLADLLSAASTYRCNVSGRPGAEAGSPTIAARGQPPRLLDAVRDLGPLTQSEIVRATGLSAGTVSNLVQELTEVAALVAVGGAPRGRRGRLLTITPPAGVALGVDVGHRHLRVVLADWTLTPIAEQRVDSPAGQEAPATLPSPRSWCGGCGTRPVVDAGSVAGSAGSARAIDTGTAGRRAADPARVAGRAGRPAGHRCWGCGVVDNDANWAHWPDPQGRLSGPSARPTSRSPAGSARA